MARPGMYSPERAAKATELAAQGKTDEQIAAAIGVSRVTLDNWKKSHPGFLSSLKDAKNLPDGKVEVSLFERATGYSHPDVDIRVVGGEIVQTPIVKHYPPDPTSMIFWLKNRQPKAWRDKVETGITDTEGNDVKYDPVDVGRRIAFLLHAAAQKD